MDKMVYQIDFREERHSIRVWVGRPMSFAGLLENYVTPLVKNLRKKGITISGITELGLTDKQTAQNTHPELIYGGRVIKVGKFWSDVDADYF